MAFRFRKSIQILPGVRMNLGKRGGSFTVGKRGASINLGSKGAFANVGIPGTGLSWRAKIGGGKSKRNSSKSRRAPQYAQASKGMTAEQRKAINVANLQHKANFFNEESTEGINQHKKIIPLPQKRDWAYVKSVACLPKRRGRWHLLLSILLFVLFIFIFLMFVSTFATKTPIGIALGTALVAFLFGFASWRSFRFWKDQRAGDRFLRKSCTDALEGKTDCIEDIFSFALAGIDWFRETIPSFEVSPDGQSVFVDIDLPEIEYIPDHSLIVKKTEQALYKHHKKEEELTADYSTHVHGITSRIAGLCFALFPTVNKVLCSGYTQRKNEQTGMPQDEYIISVIFERAKWEKSNPREAIPERFIEMYSFRREFDSRGLMKSIEPFTPDDCKNVA